MHHTQTCMPEKVGPQHLAFNAQCHHKAHTIQKWRISDVDAKHTFWNEGEWWCKVLHSLLDVMVAQHQHLATMHKCWQSSGGNVPEKMCHQRWRPQVCGTVRHNDNDNNNVNLKINGNIIVDINANQPCWHLCCCMGCFLKLFHDAKWFLGSCNTFQWLTHYNKLA